MLFVSRTSCPTFRLVLIVGVTCAFSVGCGPTEGALDGGEARDDASDGRDAPAPGDTNAGTDGGDGPGGGLGSDPTDGADAAGGADQDLIGSDEGVDLGLDDLGSRDGGPDARDGGAADLLDSEPVVPTLDGPCRGWCWQLPSPSGNAVLAMTASGHQAWAVSSRAILHWNGVKWSSSPAPRGVRLQSIFALTTEDVWAVGDAETGGVAVTLHWDGLSWSRVPNPGSGLLRTVWGSGPTEVWAAGRNASGQAAEILRWDGQRWTLLPAPGFSYIQALWGTGPDDLWISSGGLAHYDGVNWTNGWSPIAASPLAFWGSGSSEVWAVAASGTDLVALRFDGTQWAVQQTLAGGAGLGIRTLSGSSPSDLYLGGTVHWDGSRLTPLERKGVSGQVAASSTGEVWVGATHRLEQGRFVRVGGEDLPFDVRAFSPGYAVGSTGIEGLLLQDVPGQSPPLWYRKASFSPTILNAVAESFAGTFYAVGDGGTIRRFSDYASSPGTRPASHLVSAGTSANLNGISIHVEGGGPIAGSTPAVAVCTIVGDNGTILEVRGQSTSATRIASPTMAHLRAVAGNLAVGDGPTMLMRDAGGAWGPVALPPLPASTALTVLGFTSGRRWAGGTQGTLLHDDGTGWSVMASGTTADLTGIAGVPGGQAAYATTSDGELLAWNGTNWQVMWPASGVALTALRVRSETDITVAEAGGRLWRWDGRYWTQSSTDGQARGVRVAARDGTEVWAVVSRLGNTSSLAASRAYRDTGSGWERVSDGQWGDLRGVAHSASHTWVAGDGVILRWDGAHLVPAFPVGFNTSSGVAQGDTFVGVYAADDTHAWAIGNGAGLVTWDGQRWQATPLRNRYNDVYTFIDIAGTGPDDVWLLASGSPGGRALLHWDGVAWTPQTFPPVPTAGTAVSLFSEQRGIVWVNGTKALFRGDGRTWVEVRPAASSSGVDDYSDIGGTGPEDLWVAGHDGLAHHFDGTSWTSVPTGADSLSRVKLSTSGGRVWMGSHLGLQEYIP